MTAVVEADTCGKSFAHLEWIHLHNSDLLLSIIVRLLPLEDKMNCSLLSVPGLRFLPPRCLAAIAAMVTVGFTQAAEAAVLRLGPLTFSEAGGDFVLVNGQLTAGTLTATEFVLQQEVFGPNINLFIAIDGFRSACPVRGGCIFSVLSLVTNRTNTPWVFFDKELQEVYGVASPEEDGLSFGQGINQVRPFGSDRFARVDEVTDVRDFINFSAGTVAPGDTAAFRYVISDTTPINRFFLLQRPNFQTGGGGFVNPTPIVTLPTPIPSPVLSVETVPSPIVLPPPRGGEVNPVPEPDHSAAVPEPSTVLGVALFGAIVARLRQQRSQ
jgi:hypothetical protein